MTLRVIFQSTPPARGATRSYPVISWAEPLFQSTPPARGATVFMAALLTTLGISIHAPREGGDLMILRRGSRHISDFNPRPPRGGRPPRALATKLGIRISIHAPREGGDSAAYPVPWNKYISIHAPREGGDTSPYGKISYTKLFQSTPPARGATEKDINITYQELEFQSTPPARGATYYCNRGP